MSSERPPVHEMVKNAVESLGGIATYKQIIEWIDEKFRNVNHGTIRAQTIACSVNQPSRVHYPENQKERNSNPKYDLFFSVGRGKVEIFDTVKHGNWGIVEKKGKFKITHEGKIIGISEINEFYFIEKDFESTTKNKEDSQYLRERFQTLEGVLINNSKQLFDNTNSYTGQAWNQGYKAWNDYQWLGLWRHGTKIESIQFQVSLGKEQELGIGIWLDGGADNTRKHALEKIKNNKEEFLKLIEDIPNSYDIGIKKRDKTTIVKKLSDLHDVEFFETVIEELSKNKTEFFIQRKIFKNEVINFETKIVDEILSIFNNLVPVSDFLSIKNQENTESPLLQFVNGGWTTFTNYQPIIIKELLESGSENNYSVPIKKIDDKIELLNFRRDTFNIASYKTSAYPALDKFVKNKNDVIFLDTNSFENDEIAKIIELCDKEIAKQHVQSIMRDENNIYFIQAGEESKWLKEFEETKTVGITHPNAKFDLSNMSKNEIQNKTDGEYGTELFNVSQIKKGDIIAITTGSKQGIENFGIATSDYYCDSKSNTYNHKIDVEYLNFGTNKINSNTPKAIIKSDQEVPRIKEFLIGKNSMAAIKAHSCFILTQYSDSKYDDVEGEQYQYDNHKPNSRKLLKGSKFIIQTKINNENCFVGYGKIGSIAESSDTNEKGKPITKFVAKFSEYQKFDPPKLRTIELYADMKSQKAYGSQPPSLLPITRQLYTKITGEDLIEPDQGYDTVNLEPFIQALEWKPNLILYGPPGTGKTFHANELAKKIAGSIPKMKKRTWKSLATLVLLENNGEPLNYREITKRALSKKLINTKGETPHETIAKDMRNDMDTRKDDSIFVKPEDGVYGLRLPTTFEKAAEIILFAENNFMHSDKITEIALNKKMIIQKEESGVTPTRSMNQILSQDVKNNETNSKFVKSGPGKYGLRNQISDEKKSLIFKVTFHPSYSYEDFVEGYRPDIDDNTTSSPYKLKKGLFFNACESAREYPDVKTVLIIDEINRGNIPKILGELITLIEEDKRNEKYALSLAYSQDEFFVPENLCIIGTMNTADKSLMQMDDALKRRFVFEELMPDTTSLLEHLNKEKVADAEDYKKILDRINEKILGKGTTDAEQKMKQFRDRQIGHSYFWKVKNNENLQSVIKYDIIPLLQDYFYGDYNEIRNILGGEIISENNRPTDLVTDQSKANDLKIELLKI